MIQRLYICVVLQIFFGLSPCQAANGEDSSLLESLNSVDIPDTDVNFGELQSAPNNPPPIGPLLHRYYAKKQRTLVVSNRDDAISLYEKFMSMKCERMNQEQLSKMEYLLQESLTLFTKGEAYFNTVPQISIRFYKESHDLLKRVYSIDEKSICK